MNEDDLTYRVIGCAIEVHNHLGPGLLESTYEHCLLYELRQNGITASAQFKLPIEYKDIEIEAGYRLDIVIPNQLIIELKSVNELLAIHSAQLLTYMKLSKIPKGLLINFNVLRLSDGIKRLVL